jgi:hypothetical protein
MREIVNRTPHDERLLVFGLAIFMCVFLGPFDTDIDLDIWQRLAFWTVAVSVVGSVIEHCMLAILTSRWFVKFHLAFRLLIGSMIGAVPGASFMIAINTIFRPEHLHDLHFPSLWLNVTIMSLLISGLDCLIKLQLRKTSPESLSDALPFEVSTEIAPSPLSAISLPRLFSRLPDRLREGQIISMSMQDHYVEITTTLGSEMLLMRLSDAVDLLDGMPGAQTHRSHWAASAHAVELVKAGRRHELTLSDDRALPVSNSFTADVSIMLKTKEQA